MGRAFLLQVLVHLLRGNQQRFEIQRQRDQILRDIERGRRVKATKIRRGEEDLLKAIEVNGWTETRKKGGHPIYKRKLTLTNESISGTHKLEINQQVTGISTGNIPKIVDELNKSEKDCINETKIV